MLTVTLTEKVYTRHIIVEPVAMCGVGMLHTVLSLD